MAAAIAVQAGLGTGFELPATLQAMLQSVAQNIPTVTGAIIAFAYLAGIWLIFRGVYRLKQYGELRTMMSINTDLREALLLIFAGTFLLFAPTMISAVEDTLFGTYRASSLAYTAGGVRSEGEALAAIVIIIIRLLGLIAFLRGLVMVSHAGSQGNPNQSVGKAVTHIIGGALLINIHTTLAVVFSTIGGRIL